MKLHKIIFILIVFFKTETLFSKNELFNVNNIEVVKNNKISNEELADLAIKKGFSQLIERILLNEDRQKLSNLNFSSIKKLVTYYQMTSDSLENNNKEVYEFKVAFDKDQLHNLFFDKGILYSEISEKELYVLPILIKDNEIFIFNKNFFYENWNKIYKNDLVDFILPLENIEIIKIINDNKNDLIDLNIIELFKEYSNKNLAIILIEDTKSNNQKIYIKSIIQNKKISKSINIAKKDLKLAELKKKIITETKKDLINLVKSNYLIDIRTPSFLNIKLILNKKNNLVELKSRVTNLKSIEKIYVQNFNKDYTNLKIKYLGKLDKLISELEKEKIELKLINDQWVIKTF